MADSYYQHIEDEARAELAAEADERHIACVNATVIAERLRLIAMEETLRYIRDFKFGANWDDRTMRYWIAFLQQEAAKELRSLRPGSDSRPCETTEQELQDEAEASQ